MSMMNAIVGVISSRAAPPTQFYTSALYPYMFEEDMGIGNMTTVSALLWEVPNDDISLSSVTIESGSLIDTITFVNYNEPEIPAATEDLGLSAITLQSGTLVDTITYENYNEPEIPAATEDLGLSAITLQSGTLVDTITFVNYNEPEIPAATEDISLSAITIQSGTLI